MATAVVEQQVPNTQTEVTTTPTEVSATATTTAIDSSSSTGGEHKLNSAWSLWYDKKPKVVNVDTFDYTSTLVKLGTVDTVEQFWRLYSYVSRPSTLGKNCSYHLFRDEALPMWESFPNGGCWIVKIKKHSPVLDRLWEQLIFSTIGEELAELSSEVVGAVVSIRSKEDVLSIYHKDNSNSAVRFRIGELFKEVLHLGSNTLVEYKSNNVAIKDKSTFRNGKQYLVQTDSDSQSPQQQQQHPEQQKQKAKQYKKKETADNTATGDHNNKEQTQNNKQKRGSVKKEYQKKAVQPQQQQQQQQQTTETQQSTTTTQETQ